MAESNRKCVSVTKKKRMFDARLDFLGWIVIALSIILIVLGIIFLIAGIDYIIMGIILIVAGAVALFTSFFISKCRNIGEK